MMWTRRCASVAGLVTLAVTLPALLADARTLSESPRAEVLGAARAEAFVTPAKPTASLGRGQRHDLEPD